MMSSRSLSAEEVEQCLAEFAQVYEHMNYTELRALSAKPEGRWSVVDRMWRGLPVRLTIQVLHFGRLWPRVSVEIVASAEGDVNWHRTPCVYLRRYADGRLRKGGSEGTSDSELRRQSLIVQSIICGLVIVTVVLLLLMFFVW